MNSIIYHEDNIKTLGTSGHYDARSTTGLESGRATR